MSCPDMALQLKTVKMKETIQERVIKEYLSGDLTMGQLSQRYGIGKTTVHRWIQQYRGNVPRKMIPREIVILPEMAEEIRNDLPEEVKELRRQLEQEKLRTKLLTAMIDIAETELKIPIRKKFGTKPSTESGTTKSE